MLTGIEFEDDPDERAMALHDFLDDSSQINVTLEKHPKLAEAFWQITESLR